MQKITGNAFAVYAVWLISLFFAPLCLAQTYEALPDSDEFSSHEVWQASSNDYTFLQFLAEILANPEQNETTETNQNNNIQKTDNTPQQTKFPNH